MGHSSRGIYSYFIYLDKCSGGDYHLRGTGRAITPKPPPSLHTWLLMCVFWQLSTITLPPFIVTYFTYYFPKVIFLKVEEVDVDVKDGRGVQTPLSLAIKAQNRDAVKLLIGRSDYTWVVKLVKGMSAYS